MKENIIKKAKNLGIDLIGFTDSNIMELKTIKEKKKKLGFTCSFEKDYLDPKEVMASVNTVISIALAYPMKSNKIVDNIISNSSWGIDYHIVLSEKMQKLMNYVKQIYPSLEYKILVDNHFLDDNFFAYKAGIGFFGKNNLIINEKYGSNIFLGTILTNLNIEQDCIVSNLCGDCKKCIQSCPGKALTENNLLNSNNCYSFITQKSTLTTTEEQKINKYIYGCDICGLVCPLNADNHQHEEFEPLTKLISNFSNIKSLSQKEFKNQYGILACSWRGKKILLRNYQILKKNLLLK